MSRRSNNSAHIRTIATSVVFFITVLGLASCKQYFERQDALTLTAGDSIAKNKATHTINPWPPGSRNPRQATNDARALIAIERYQKNESLDPAPIRTQTSVKTEE